MIWFILGAILFALPFLLGLGVIVGFDELAWWFLVLIGFAVVLGILWGGSWLMNYGAVQMGWSA